MGVPSNANDVTWFVKLEDIYVYDPATFKEGVTEVYISALFYVVTTYGTVGYGDIISTNVGEMVFTMFLSVFGVIQYGYSVQKMKSWVETFRTQDVIDQGEVPFPSNTLTYLLRWMSLIYGFWVSIE